MFSWKAASFPGCNVWKVHGSGAVTCGRNPPPPCTDKDTRGALGRAGTRAGTIFCQSGSPVTQQFGGGFANVSSPLSWMSPFLKEPCTTEVIFFLLGQTHCPECPRGMPLALPCERAGGLRHPRKP